ncbi:MAG: DUF6088 family protein [Prevotellaceae bacterium]|nr:DUF6088 family protein [Prevotellaceae bacterium]MDY6199700.1 DUF6088 family protein [Prevotella sp.]
MRIIHLDTSTYCNILRVFSESTSKVFYIEDFAQCGTYTAIRSELVRLEQKGILIRLARGIYMHENNAGKHTISEIVDLILDDFRIRFGIDFYPTGNFLLYKAGILSDLPNKIELAYEHIYPRKINLFSKHHIEFKHSPCTWINKVIDSNLRNLLIVLSSKWKEDYRGKKEDVIKRIASKVDRKTVSQYEGIIPLYHLKRCKSILYN